jgi:hypothetical protein
MKDKPRELTVEEQNLLLHLLTHASNTAKSFVGQVPFTKATSGCTCGCPSIRLVVDKSAVVGHATERIIADMLGATPNGLGVGVLVFADEGYLSDLEVYDFEGHVTPFPLPTLESLHPF